jgi:hypothetical protein
MKYIISEPRLSMFLRRRFSPEDLLWIVNDVKKMIEQGYNVDTALYGGIREFIKSGFADIDEFGYEQSYWDSYLKYEDALIPYVKSQLGLD